MQDKLDTIDEVPTKADILSAIPKTIGINSQHTSNDVKQVNQLPEKKSPVGIKNEEMRMVSPQQGIIRDQKGRIVKPVPQQTNKNGKAGRKPAINEEVLEILRQAFLTGATDEEAAEFADISAATLYNYQRENPEFLENKEAWKTNPIMKARMTVYNSLNDPRIAAWFLERKKKDEFSTRTEHTGKDGEDLPPVRIEYVTPTDAARVSKNSIRSDAETASSLDAVNGSDNE